MNREEARAQLHKALDLFMDAHLALTAPAAPSDSEIMTTGQAAREAGRHAATVTLWCQKGFIDGAYQSVERGQWRFTRGAWQKFLDSRLRRSRSRGLRSVA